MYGGDRVALLSHATEKRLGKELNVYVVILYHIENGLMIEADLVVAIDPCAFDEFWSK
jgi:hypothetical protein